MNIIIHHSLSVGPNQYPDSVFKFESETEGLCLILAVTVLRPGMLSEKMLRSFN
jgi:hypothetical protein